MPQFRYEAKDPQGNTISGLIGAEDNKTAVSLLHKKNLTIISLSQEKRKAFKAKRVKLDELVIFSRQLATMVDSGISLVQALSILSEQSESKALSATTVIIRGDIESGSSFYNALSKHPQVFSELYINMAKAGESSGKLDEILDRLATYLEKANSLQRKVRSSLVYPAVVISLALIITIV
ncbi:MAG: type II secretion system F family protein, partial [Candidatus Omnitrophica bacterium]|nr:type II secretion system F family protein [Candidatus Omnitrophota bacterium]